MAERSEAPDSKNIPLSLWYSNVCVGSNTTPVECCVQKANTFCSKQFLWELNEKQDEADSHYEKLLTKTDWSNCDIRFLKTGWSSGLRRQTQGNSNETSGTRMCAWVPIPLLSKFLFKKTTFSWKQYSREPNEEQDLTLREGVIGKIPKQLRYTTKRSMAERSKAPDPKNSFELFILECVRGFENYTCRILRSKANILFEAVFVRVKRRARWRRIYLARNWYRNQTETIAIYDFWRQDGRAV